VQSSYLIVGLGNPGKQYEKTRHNVGFQLIDEVANRYKIKFQEKKKLLGELGTGEIRGNRVILLKPTTYMNLSGKAIKKCIEYYNICKENVLVLVDDFDIPLGELRLKFYGGAGTHNGLKSVEEELQSKSYVRLKVGIRIDKINNLEEFVLEKFSSEETKILDSALKKALDSIELFFEKGKEIAMNFTNTRIKKYLGENK
jgi:peptidyl-tRNA hydrolase, PTH1 family